MIAALDSVAETSLLWKTGFLNDGGPHRRLKGQRYPISIDVYDLIFIDGLHRHPQVTHDFEGMLPYSDTHSLFVFHDSWLFGIPEAAQRAKELTDASRSRPLRAACAWSKSCG